MKQQQQGSSINLSSQSQELTKQLQHQRDHKRKGDGERIIVLCACDTVLHLSIKINTQE
jgi:hypothetical protein